MACILMKTVASGNKFLRTVSAVVKRAGGVAIVLGAGQGEEWAPSGNHKHHVNSIAVLRGGADAQSAQRATHSHHAAVDAHHQSSVCWIGVLFVWKRDEQCAADFVPGGQDRNQPLPVLARTSSTR